jgi:hypothetical protein
MSRHQFSQSRGSTSQSRDWAFNLLKDCPGKRGRYCILQNDRIMISEEEYD